MAPIFADPNHIYRMFLVKRLLLLLPLVGLMSSCSEDFDVSAPYKSVTVIYGLLNAGDTAHYIRIQKAFLDEHKSAIDMAKVPDSNFYASINVHLKELTDTSRTGVLLFDEELPRVDLNTEGFPKDSGVFFNAPSYAYKSKRVLTPGRAYRIVVTNPSTGQVDSASTFLIYNKPAVVPFGFNVQQFHAFYIMSFPAVLETSEFTLNAQIPLYSQIYEGIIRFHYMEKDAAGTERWDSADYHFATASRDLSDPTRVAVALTTLQRSFYYFLEGAIGKAPANTQRYLDSSDIFVWAGSADMANYQKINGAQGGITADQIKPLFTNIKSNRPGGGTLGLFTSRARVEYHNVGIDNNTLDSLMKNSITYPLNIRGRTTR